MLAQRFEPFVGGFGRHDRESVHLEKLHQRTPDRHVVFDDEHEARGIFRLCSLSRDGTACHGVGPVYSGKEHSRAQKDCILRSRPSSSPRRGRPPARAERIRFRRRPREPARNRERARSAARACPIVYGRPSMRGRDRVRRAGAVRAGLVSGCGRSDPLESSTGALLGSLRIPAGPHTIWMLPTADHWTTDREPGAERIPHALSRIVDLGRVELEKGTVGAGRTLRSRSAAIREQRHAQMSWEKTEVSLPFAIVQSRLSPVRACSSVVEHPTFNRMVVGSIPTRRTFRRFIRCPAPCHDGVISGALNSAFP